MPRILVTEAFKFAVDGNHVLEVALGEHDVSERCALVAVEHLQVATLLDDVAAPAPIVVPPAAAPVTPPTAKPAATLAKAPIKPKTAAKAKPVAKAATAGDGA